MGTKSRKKKKRRLKADSNRLSGPDMDQGRRGSHTPSGSPSRWDFYSVLQTIVAAIFLLSLTGNIKLFSERFDIQDERDRLKKRLGSTEAQLQKKAAELESKSTELEKLLTMSQLLEAFGDDAWYYQSITVEKSAKGVRSFGDCEHVKPSCFKVVLEGIKERKDGAPIVSLVLEETFMTGSSILTQNINRFYVDIEEGFSREVKSKVADFRFAVEEVAFESVTLGIAARSGDGRGFFGQVDEDYPELTTVTHFLNLAGGPGAGKQGTKDQPGSKNAKRGAKSGGGDQLEQ